MFFLSHWVGRPPPPQQLQTSITSLSDLWFYKQLVHWHFFLCVDADRLLNCPVWASIAGILVVLTSVVLGATPGSLLFHHNTLVPKVLEAYVGSQLCQPSPPTTEQHDLYERWPKMGAKLPSMLWVIIVLLRQRDDEFKIGWTCIKVRT